MEEDHHKAATYRRSLVEDFDDRKREPAATDKCPSQVALDTPKGPGFVVRFQRAARRGLRHRLSAPAPRG